MDSNAASHPDCINSSNPYHECTEYCFKLIAEKHAVLESMTETNEAASEERVDHPDEATHGNEAEGLSEKNDEEYAQMTERQKKLFDLRLKLNQARKANQGAVLAEKKRADQPEESRGVSKQKWFEDKKNRMSRELDANGLDMKKAFMLDTQEDAEAKYKKWEKKEAPFGWDVFNQRSLYNAYKKRTKSIPYSKEDYLKIKETEDDFYRDDSSLLYGNSGNIPEENVEKMVKELEERESKRKDFSRRRKFNEDKDIDSINARNEHFNRKIERAFGKYTVEIKNNLERGTALPD